MVRFLEVFFAARELCSKSLARFQHLLRDLHIKPNLFRLPLDKVGGGPPPPHARVSRLRRPLPPVVLKTARNQG